MLAAVRDEERRCLHVSCTAWDDREDTRERRSESCNVTTSSGWRGGCRHTEGTKEDGADEWDMLREATRDALLPLYVTLASFLFGFLCFA